MGTEWREKDDEDIEITGLDEEAQPLPRLSLSVWNTFKQPRAIQRWAGGIVVLLVVALAVSSFVGAQVFPEFSNLLSSKLTQPIPRGSIVYTYSGQGTSSSPVWTSDGKYLVIVNGDDASGASVYLWQRATKKLTQTLTLPTLPTATLATCMLAPDGKHILFASDKGLLEVWDTLSGRNILTYNSHADVWPIADWSPDGTRLAFNSNDKDGEVQIWDVNAGRRLSIYSGTVRSIFDLSWSPDGQHIASLSRDRVMQIWNVSIDKTLLTLPNPNLQYVVWSPDGRELLAISDDQVANAQDRSQRLWDAITGRELLTYLGNTRSPFTAQWSADGRSIVSESVNETQVWNAATGHTLLSFPVNNGIVQLSPDGTRLALSTESNQVQLWNVSTDRKFLTYNGNAYGVDALAWSPNGRSIASVSGGTILVWNASTGKSLYHYEIQSEVLQGLVWSPDNKLLATWDAIGTVTILQAG